MVSKLSEWRNVYVRACFWARLLPKCFLFLLRDIKGLSPSSHRPFRKMSSLKSGKGLLLPRVHASSSLYCMCDNKLSSQHVLNNNQILIAAHKWKTRRNYNGRFRLVALRLQILDRFGHSDKTTTLLCTRNFQGCIFNLLVQPFVVTSSEATAERGTSYVT